MLIFAIEMKRFALFSLYWAVSLLLLAAILYSMGYRVSEALLLSSSLLPVAIVFRQMIARVSFSASRREVAKSLVCILLFVLITAFLAVHLAQTYILCSKSPDTYVWELDVPPMLLNPVFLLSMLTLMIIGDYGLGRVLGKRLPEAEETITFASDLQSTTSVEQDNPLSENKEQITFFSNRQSVTLARQEILYVESCDTEVWIHATDGRRFRNKTSISSWSRLLGAEYRFGISIERAYWGLGIGRALTRACIECARRAGYAQLELTAVAENRGALALYESEGFVEYGRNPLGFRSRRTGWQEIVLMRLELKRG